MTALPQHWLKSGRNRACLGICGLICAAVLSIAACGSHRQVRIAVIPQTEGTPIWEAAHVGAEAAAHQTGSSIYWIAPALEDDVEAQIALVDRVVIGNYQGLVLAPDQALSLISPVRRALAQGIPTVVIGTPLPLPAGGNLSYILNDDEEGGRIAARRAASLVKGIGTVAILGINPDIAATMIRARAFEESLAQLNPGIRIVERRMGKFNVAHEQQVAEDTLRANPNLDLIVALMGSTIDGSLSALNSAGQNRAVRIIGFDAFGTPLFRQKPSLDSVIQSDTRSMAQQAVQLICAKRAGQSAPTLVYVQPKLLNRENIDTAEARRMLSEDWTLGHWTWSSTQ